MNKQEQFVEDQQGPEWTRIALRMLYGAHGDYENKKMHIRAKTKGLVCHDRVLTCYPRTVGAEYVRALAMIDGLVTTV
jgi:hypothetical protein